MRLEIFLVIAKNTSNQRANGQGKATLCLDQTTKGALEAQRVWCPNPLGTKA